MSIKPEEVTLAQEWRLYASEVPELLKSKVAEHVWTAGFACALQVARGMPMICSSAQEFAENMERLLAEAEAKLAGTARQ